MSTFENIKTYFQNKQKSSQTFPMQNLFIGTRGQIIKNNYTKTNYQYTHYDCFLGDSNILHNCKEFTILTKTPNEKIKVTKINQRKVGSHYTIFLQTSNDTQYKIDYPLYKFNNHDLNIYNYKLIDENVSLKYINETFAKINEYQRQNTDDLRFDGSYKN